MADFGCAIISKKRTASTFALALEPCPTFEDEETKTETEESESDNELVGSRDYISPEGINANKGSKVQPDFCTDLWSLGVIIWQLYSKDNSTPFKAETTDETFANIQACNYKMP